jgi:mono/diheme cytochrome c family protein
MKIVFMTAAIVAAFGFSVLKNNFGNSVWIAPPEADKIVNPLKGNATATEEGKKTFTQFCAMCHGDKGKGDGVAGLALNPRPANYTLPKTQLQSDGVLFWKMTTGRPPMASYKDILTETQRWQLVNYLRTFKK